MSFHWHWTNDNRNGDDKISGSGFWAGRAWFYLNTEGGFGQKTVGLEWRFGGHARHTMIEMWTNFVMDREITLAVGLWHVFNFYMTFAFPLLPNWSVEHGDRESGIRIFDNAIWIDFWSRRNEWRSKDPFWLKGITIHPIDLLLGKGKYGERYLAGEHYAEVEMPEGNYPAKIAFFENEYKRPRWPIIRRTRGAKIKMFKPVPIPGKGENSWDCEDDAIYSMYCPAETVEDAIAAVSASVMRKRERYGGKEWLPE